MNSLAQHYANQLIHILSDHLQIMDMLKRLQHVEPQAYIAAGIIRNTVWAHLHGIEYDLDQTEVDVIFYAAQDDGTQAQRIEQAMLAQFPHVQWDVTNQALVHTWYKKDNGDAIAPLTSIAHALSLWPETATAIAVRLDRQNNIECVAPFGLDDLFQLKLRWNPTLVSHDGFMHRLHSKRFLQRWSKLKLEN